MYISPTMYIRDPGTSSIDTIDTIDRNEITFDCHISARHKSDFSFHNCSTRSAIL